MVVVTASVKTPNDVSLATKGVGFPADDKGVFLGWAMEFSKSALDPGDTTPTTTVATHRTGPPSLT